jgi:hypothetical protein
MSCWKEKENMFCIGRNSKLFLFALLLATVSCSSSAKQEKSALLASPVGTAEAIAYPSPSPQVSSDGKLKQFLPDDVWVSIFFDRIDARAKKSGLSNLRETFLAEGDLEARVWAFDSVTNSAKGFVIKRHAGQWEAYHLREAVDTETETLTTRYPQPPLGWDYFWEELVAEGILSLPDASQIHCAGAVTDGEWYVVEINSNHSYRAYSYDNPHVAECPEAKKIMRIVRKIWPQI